MTPVLVSSVGAVSPVQNLSFKVVGAGLRVPLRAVVICILYVAMPEVATTFRSLSTVTVPPDSPLTVNVKEAALFVVVKEPAKPIPDAWA